MSNDIVAIKKAQNVLKSQTLPISLIHIKSNFECLPMAIKQFQEQKLSLFDSIQITEKISEIFKQFKNNTLTVLKLNVIYFLK